MMLLFEVLGWIFVGQSFIANPLRLRIMILQEAEIGIIAVGVTQVIIMGGIDLSSGSVVGMTAMIAASLAQAAGYTHAIYPSLTGLNPIFPVAAGLVCGLIAGLINGVADRSDQNPALHRHARHDGVGARRRRLVHERPADRQSFGRVRRHRRGLVAGDHLPRRRVHLSHRAALHPLRQVHLRHRRQSARGARLRHQCRTPRDPRLYGRGAALGSLRHRAYGARRSAARPGSASASNSTPSPRR